MPKLNPCNNCPFRISLHGRYQLSPERANAIIHGLMHDGPFPCHKTVDYSESGTGRSTEETTLCKGAALFLENTVQGGMRSNVCFRLGMAIGQLDSEPSDRSAVYGSIEDFIEGATNGNT